MNNFVRKPHQRLHMQKSSRPLASFVGRRAFTSQTAAMMLSGIASILPNMGAAQTAYPSKSIRLLVGYQGFSGRFDEGLPCANEFFWCRLNLSAD
jgi:hypothetical protein